jgi:CLIP-associating protein 1/2
MFGGSTIRRSLTGAVTLANQRPAAIPLAKLNTTGYEESLLLAQTIPLPDESDDDDESNQMLSFSAPYERYHAHAHTRTATSSNSANSPPLSAPEPIVEDALRARAEQAESAAERLLELVEPEDPNLISPIPPSLLPSSSTNGAAAALTSTGNRVTKPVSAASVIASPLIAKVKVMPPVTPANKRASVLKQAALFKDSPVHKKGPSLLDVLNERKHETGWWLKRMSCKHRYIHLFLLTSM